MKSEEWRLLPLPLLWYLRLLELRKIDFPIRERFPIQAGTRASDPGADRCRSPIALLIKPLYRPALIDAFRLDLELPFLRRVDIQVVKSIQFGPIAPDPTRCSWAARAFDFHCASREWNGDFSVC